MRIFVFFSVLSAYLVWKLSTVPGVFEAPTVSGNPLDIESASNQLFDPTLILGILFVFLFYWFKFNEWAGESDAPAGFRPRPVRHFATWLRYLGWNTTYGLMMVGVFSVFVFFPDLVQRVIGVYIQTSQNFGLPVSPSLPEIGSVLDNTLTHRIHNPMDLDDIVPVVVMLVTVVWSGIKPFSEFERRFRLGLQERAAVPTQARDLIESFAVEGTTFSPEPGIIKKVVDKADDRISPDDFDVTQHDKSSYIIRYARAEYLYYRLEQYKRKPVFSQITERYLYEFQDLDQRINHLRDRVSKRLKEVRKFVIAEELRDQKFPTPSFGEAEKLITEIGQNKKYSLLIEHFDSQSEELEGEIESTFRDILRLIICSILAVGKSSLQRHELFEEFDLKPRDRITIQLDWPTLTMVIAGTTSIVFACSFAYYLGLDYLQGESDLIPKDLNEVLFWSVSGCMMHFLAIIGGYSVQQSLGARRKHLQLSKTRLPRRSELFSEACWAAAFGVSLNVFLLALLVSLDGQFNLLEHIWWWALIPGVTAFFAAVYTQQDNRYRLFGRGLEANKSLRDRQIFILQVVSTVLVAAFVSYALHHQIITLANHKMLAFLAYTVITTTLIAITLAMILREWVSAEQKHGGEFERRSNRIEHEAEATWWKEEQSLEIRTLSVSDNGATISATDGLQVGDEGKIEMDSKGPRLAEVLRQDDQNTDRYYIRFLQQAT